MSQAFSENFTQELLKYKLEHIASTKLKIDGIHFLSKETNSNDGWKFHLHCPFKLDPEKFATLVMQAMQQHPLGSFKIKNEPVETQGTGINNRYTIYLDNNNIRENPSLIFNFLHYLNSLIREALISAPHIDIDEETALEYEEDFFSLAQAHRPPLVFMNLLNLNNNNFFPWIQVYARNDSNILFYPNQRYTDISSITNTPPSKMTYNPNLVPPPPAVTSLMTIDQVKAHKYTKSLVSKQTAGNSLMRQKEHKQTQTNLRAFIASAGIYCRSDMLFRQELTTQTIAASYAEDFKIADVFDNDTFCASLKAFIEKTLLIIEESYGFSHIEKEYFTEQLTANIIKEQLYAEFEECGDTNSPITFLSNLVATANPLNHPLQSAPLISSVYQSIAYDFLRFTDCSKLSEQTISGEFQQFMQDMNLKLPPSDISKLLLTCLFTKIDHKKTLISTLQEGVLRFSKKTDRTIIKNLCAAVKGDQPSKETIRATKANNRLARL